MAYRAAFVLLFALFTLRGPYWELVPTLALAGIAWRKDRLAAGCALVLAATMLWALLFRNYGAGYRFDIFRGVFAHEQGLLYGSTQHAPLLAFGLAAAALLCRRLPPPALQLALLVAFSYADFAPRLGRAIHHQARFAEDLALFGPREPILPHYVARMSEMSLHTSHYPPGNLLLHRYLTLPGVQALVAAFAIATGFFLEAPALYAVSAAATIFPLTCMDAMLALFTGVALWAFRRDRPIAAGLAVATFAFFSFAAPLLLLVLALYRRWRALVVTVGVAAIALLILRLATGYDTYACFRLSQTLNARLMGTASGFDHPIRYLFRASGNFLGVFFAIGLPAGVAALRRPGPGVLAWMIVSLGGFYFMETERTLLFLAPALFPENIEGETRDFSLVLTAVYALTWRPYPV